LVADTLGLRKAGVKCEEKILGAFFSAGPKKTGLSAPTPRAAALRGFRFNPLRAPQSPCCLYFQHYFLWAPTALPAS
jgi:hypothetical protein